ncbi:peroxisomal matrix protein [Purpureocillium lavendulum]|uniref:Thioredoxin peroxidase n=1 Tax=Purpureocillium lavendulum TaxID=1247861 RepID=A0AB34G8V0_9HYPO|nr:peroxisomal matrix protein [Purpureocillium lavendulum]
MAALAAGDSFPEGVSFSYIPYADDKEALNACGVPVTYDASKEFSDKKVVLFSVPGAFTGTCSQKHLPGYIENIPRFREKGVHTIACIAYNDAYVMSAWGKTNLVKNDDILFLSDTNTAFSTSLGWLKGERTARYAMIIDHGKVVYAEKEPGRDVTVSSADVVLAQL